MMANVGWRYMVGDCLAPGLNEIKDDPSQDTTPTQKYEGCICHYTRGLR